MSRTSVAAVGQGIRESAKLLGLAEWRGGVLGILSSCRRIELSGFHCRGEEERRERSIHRSAPGGQRGGGESRFGGSVMVERSFVEALALLFTWTLFQKIVLDRIYPWNTASRSGDRDEKESENLKRLKTAQADLHLVKQYGEDGGWIKVNDAMFLPPGSTKTNTLPFTRKVLVGKNKIYVEPDVFMKKDNSESITIIKIGDDLCGHPGVVHGGMLATVFDSSMALIAHMNAPQRMCYTANLNIDFRSPTPSDEFLLFTTMLEKVEGRKVYVKSVATDLDRKIKYSEATALFISPKPGIKSFIVAKLMPT